MRTQCRAFLSVSALALATIFLAGGCRTFDNIVGLSHFVGDNQPEEPGVATPTGWPVLVLAVADSSPMIGVTEPVTGVIYIAPVTRYSQPVGAYTDTSARLISPDTSIVSVDGTVIHARSAGKVQLAMNGYSGVFPVNAYLTITVRAASTH